LRELLSTIYLFFPLLMGLMLHGLCIKFNWLSFLYHPIDRGRLFRGRRILGANKTWRGIVAVSIGTAIGFAMQSMLFHRFSSIRAIELFDYSLPKAFFVGLALGAASMLSELPNSFVKRQMEIAPGSAAEGWKSILFYAFDQVDFLFGAWLVLAAIIPVTFERILLSFAFLFISHQALTSIGYLLGMRSTAR
jgi:hypothetical protein